MDETYEWDLLPDDLFTSSWLESPDLLSSPKHVRRADASRKQPNQTSVDNANSSTTTTEVISPFLERILQQRENKEKNVHSIPQIKPRAFINLSRETLGPNIWAPLSRPLIYGNRVVVGTETAILRGPEGYRSTPGFIVCDLDVNWSRTENPSSRLKVLDSSFVATDSSITDLQWIEPGGPIIYSTEQGMGILFSDNRTLPLNKQPHTKRVRQIVIDAVQKNRFVSGGFDETVALNYLNDTGSGILSSWNLHCGGIVGSVGWHPVDSNVITYTLDSGIFGMIDVRSRTNPFTLDFGRGALYTHNSLNEHLLAVGFGSGNGLICDIRQGATPLKSWKDPCVTSIGELLDARVPGEEISQDTTPIVVASGIGGLSVWDFSRQDATCLGYDSPNERYTDVPVAWDGFKTSGSFVNTHDQHNLVYVQTDAAGYLSIYDL